MLHNAVQNYQKEQSAPNLLKTPHLDQARKEGNTGTRGGGDNALKPAAASTLNALNKSQQKLRANSGLKRTASGLAKVFESSFEDVRGSQERPIEIDEKSPRRGRVVQLTQNEFIDENDFDSDIDLDIEEPVAHQNSMKKPNHINRASALPVGNIVYPTLPRQQQAQSSFTRHLDSSYTPMHSAGPDDNIGSSAPVPWSSSPDEHFRPAMSPSMLRNFNYQPNRAPQHLQNGAPPPSAEDRPTKRRTIPWNTKASEDRPATPAATVDVHSKQAANTPKDKKSAYLWNTTASAIKEQQKQHREQVKKSNASVKMGEGDEEAVRKAKSSRQRPARVFLSEEQQHVLNLVIEKKKSVFFTGSAGTGKSVLMREIISSLRSRFTREPDRVAVTASTGLAACNVGGVTLHSFAGIGLGKEDAPTLVRKIKKNQKAKHRWMRTKVLVIDEVSMVDGELFDKLESVARQIRNNGRPFGGIQLVITGDFFQLPPVPDSGKVAKFAFDAATWSTTIEHTIGLHHVFRQKDPVFAGMLNEMREGRLTQASINAFRQLTRPLNFEDELECTELYPRREDVEKANWERLHNLQGDPYVFDARDGGAIADKAQRDRLLQNCMAPESITLKKGAQVMLIKNVDESLVNGSIGQVMGLMDEQQFDRYTADEDEFHQSGEQNGLQGKRLHDSVTTARRWPVVRFLIADGTTRDLLCQPETWKVEQPNGEVQASRAQVPLILAWALSIHKAQGQTLDRVKVDLGKVFEKGQAYVALSRATSMAGLQVLRFDPKKVNAHDRVRHFYNNLSKVELDGMKKEKAEDGGSKKPGISGHEYEQMLMEDEWVDLR